MSRISRIAARAPFSRLVLASCVATFLANVASGQSLTLFPGAPQQVVDGGAGDQDATVNGTIVLSNHPMPDFPGNANSTFVISGDIISSYVGPTNSTAGVASVTITNAVIENTNASSFNAIGSNPFSPTDYLGMLEFVFFQHGPLGGSGSITASINGTVEQPGSQPPAPVPNTIGADPQLLNLGASDTSFSGTNPFAYALAIRTAPNTTTIPAPISAAGATSGAFSGSGTLQLHIDDGLVLGPLDRMVLPSSIEVVATGSPIPEPTTMVLIVLSTLSVVLAGAAGRRRQT